jgi:hypothetical protein
MDGEGWGGEVEEIVFGMWYTTEEHNFSDNPVGGASYTDGDNLQVLGGSTYTNTVNDNPYVNL